MVRQERKYLFVVNPISGGRKKEEVPEQVDSFCNEAKCDFRLYKTTGKNDLERLKKLLDSFQPDAVVAIGGDGTVNLVGNLLVNSNTPLGIIPLGSGNGLAKDLGIPMDIDEAFNLIDRFESKYIDTLKVNEQICFHLCDLGFNARIVHRFAQSIFRGKVSYLWYGLQEFFKYRSFPYEIKTRISNYEGKAFMMIISNANKFGTNVSINPLGEIDDGWFEISIIKPFPRFMVPYIFYHLWRDTIYKTPYYKIVRSRKVLVKNTMQEFFHIDGEPVSASDQIHVEILPHSLRVLM